mmetsp:Transcript_36609/g.72383  ORF Transcript_36609/g.72383 Transcript_36609/m.72383 type:complete len:664 (-) Transcript_36609:152-2143(-)
MSSWQGVPLPACGVANKWRRGQEVRSVVGLWRMANYFRNSIQCGIHPESQHDDSRADASSLSFLGENPSRWPEVPTAKHCNGVSGSDRDGFSLRTMLIIAGVSVLLAATGTATAICTLEDCRHMFSVPARHNQSPPCDARWDRGGLANPLPSEAPSEARGAAMGAGAVSTPGTALNLLPAWKPSASPMSLRNPNAVEASLYSGGRPTQQGSGLQPASAVASSSADDSNTWQVVHDGFLDVRSDSCLTCKVIGMKDKCIMVTGHREGDWIRLIYEPGYMLAVANGSTLLQKSEVAYSKIHMGTCAEHGLHPITDDISCEAAALAIGFPDLPVKVMHETEKPEGCYMLEGTLWLSVNPENKGHGVMGQRRPLCSSRLTPAAVPCQKLPVFNPPSPIPAQTTRTHRHSSHSGQHTFFCFSLIQLDTAEIKLLTVQVENSASIFRCDGSAVLSIGTRELKVGPKWRTIPLPSSSSPQNGTAGTSSSLADLSKTYMQAWDLLMEKGTIWSYKWTVKVDSSSVFFPNRLLKRLESFFHSRVHDEAGEELFTQSCNSRQGPSDTVAMYSREALRTYQHGRARCKSDLKWHTWSNAYFMQQCFHLLGLNRKQDMETTKSIFGMGTCHPSSCRDRSQVSFNGFKNASHYISCFEQANEEDMEGLWKTDEVKA